MEQRRQISESDWKLWRRLREEALERYCQKALDDFAKLKNGEASAHERYLKLYQLVKRRDKKLGEIFDGPSRSNAFFQIALALRARLLSADEMAGFSDETQNVIAFLTRSDG
jgi:hypothetical protein